MDSTPQIPHRDELGAPGLLVVALIVMTFMVGAIWLLAVTGAAWALWLACVVLLLSFGVLMASIVAMIDGPDEPAGHR